MAADALTAFLSYCRQDSEEFALRLAEDLKAAGAAVWIDQLDIQPGQRWDRAVRDALANCPRMLVILSAASVDSDNVLDEIDLALEKRKTIIPVLFNDCETPLRLRRVQHIDFRQDYARGLKALLKVLGVHQDVEPSLHMPPPEAEKPRVKPARAKPTRRKKSEQRDAAPEFGEQQSDLSEQRQEPYIPPAFSDQPFQPSALRELYSLEGHTDEIWGVGISADGRLAVSGSFDCTLKIWDLTTGDELHTLDSRGAVWAVAVSGDGRLAVSAPDDCSVSVWDLASGRELHVLEGHEAGVTGVAVSEDGRLAVSASNDQTLKVWDVDSGCEVTSFEADAPLLCCVMSPDGRTILAGDDKGVIHVLGLE